jgi:hypothetical protein
MWFNLLIILGTCLAGVGFGLAVYWLIIKVQKTRRVAHAELSAPKKISPAAITEDIANPPLVPADKGPELKRETAARAEDDNWLNNGIPEAAPDTIKKEDDDWLNAGVEEVSTNVLKKQDDDWLNAENEQLLEPVDESSLDTPVADSPEIQIKQDGSLLNITVITSRQPNVRPEQTVINLKINVPPEDLDGNGEEPFAVEVMPDGSSLSDQSLEDMISVKSTEDPDDQSYSLMDEISVKRVDGQA